MKNSDFDFNGIKEGRIVKGTVIRKTDGDIYVDIEYKSEGIIPREETQRYGYYDEINDGDSVDVLVKRIEGQDDMVVLSKIIADKKRIFSAVKKAHKDGSFMNGVITKQVKGGFIIDFGANVTAFLPMSHSRPLEGELEGREIFLKIIQLDEEKRNVVVSYKEYMNEKDKTEKEERMKIFPVNEKILVEVAGVAEKGIDVIKDGKKGFIPKTEVSWKIPENIYEEYPRGKKIEVLVVSNSGDEAVLSVKRLAPNPYKPFAEKHKSGDTIKVVVKELISEGVIVSVNEEIDGFIHISEISYFKRIKNAAGIFNKGDEIDAQIIKVDDEKNRIYLSLKRMEDDPWPDIEERYPVDARVSGTIGNIAEGEGVFVELEENLDAFVGVRDISWFDYGSISEVVRAGEKKDFRILGIDKTKNRIMLGIKQLTVSPWAGFEAKYKEGAGIDVKVADIEESCILCEVVPGVTGRIPIKSKSKIKAKQGDIINARITRIDRQAKRVTLSSREIEITEEKKQLDEYMKKHDHSFKMNDLINFGGNENEEKK